MDEIVLAALRKWPDVPHCYGWLALDARGHWYMRDERVQAAGSFPQHKGSRIEHDKLLAFVHRNYAQDSAGAAYFQNGPQRVYVELEAAPYVWRVGGAAPAWTLTTHTGLECAFAGAWLDEMGRLFVQATAAPGLNCFGIVHSLDVGLASAAIESGLWPLQEMRYEHMPERFGFVAKPRPRTT